MTIDLLTNFGVCTDEVHQDLETALRVAKQLEMQSVELLECWNKPVVSLEDDEIDRARDLLDRLEMRVSAIGSMFLKLVYLQHVPRGAVAQDESFRDDLELLRSSVRVAKRLSAPIVRSYAFRREGMNGVGNPSPRLPKGGEVPDEILEKIAEGLRIALRETEEAGLVLGLENVRSCWANTGHNAARILQAVNNPALRAIWDPANDYVSGGVPYPEGYEAVKNHICHVHVKDASLADPVAGLTSWEPVGRGEIDWVGQFHALYNDGYSGSFSLETHWHPVPEDGGEPDRIADSRTSFEGVLKALGGPPQVDPGE